MISIVIPTLNEELYLPTLLNSLRNQVISEDVELIIADNASTDRTREVARSNSALFHRLRIIDGGRPAVGRNNGAHHSGGDPIFFIDADLELRNQHFLAQSTREFRRRRLAAASVRLSPMSDLWRDHLMVGFYNLLLQSTYRFAPLGAMLIISSRSTFEKVGGFPEDVAICEDHDFVGRCSSHGSYGIVSGRAHFNVRRFRHEGRLRLCLKYIRATYLRVAHGPVRHFDYEFGCFGDETARAGPAFENELLCHTAGAPFNGDASSA